VQLVTVKVLTKS